ncbi:MAG: aminoacyl-histidine dipeptidase, partial [Anaeromyxobacteraceae bacterium]
ALEADVARLAAERRAAFGQLDPGISYAVEPAADGAPMAADDAFVVAGLLATAPHGVEELSPELPGLVQTSTNLGVAETQGNLARLCFLTRSSVDTSRRALVERIGAACALAGFSTELQGGYPGWKPEPGAGLVALVRAVHAERLGKAMAVRALHAGLECGIIGEKYPAMEMVSFGPTITDAHTPDERVSVPSVATFWTLLVAVLERIAAEKGA